MDISYDLDPSYFNHTQFIQNVSFEILKDQSVEIVSLYWFELTVFVSLLFLLFNQNSMEKEYKSSIIQLADEINDSLEQIEKVNVVDEIDNLNERVSELQGMVIQQTRIITKLSDEVEQLNSATFAQSSSSSSESEYQE